MTEIEKLQKKARNLRSEMRKLGPLLKGSVVLRDMKCGKPNCKCTRGIPHQYLCITYKEKGKTKTVYVDKKKYGQALMWSANYKRFKELVEQHSKINLALLRSRERTKKRKE